MRVSRSICYLAATVTTAAAQDTNAPKPTEFTSSYEIVATPNAVVDANNTFTGGLAGAQGLYKFSLNSKTNTICYDITLTGFRGDYVSPASTATHIHEAVAGKAGPPRIAFPNPVGTDTRRSVGCIQGTADGFVTGLIAPTTGQDQGYEFNVKRIEDNPTGFFADVHSSQAVPGAVRGQFSAVVNPVSSASASASAPASSAPVSSAPVSSPPVYPSPEPTASSTASLTTYLVPSNCTSACTTIIEPCTEQPAAPYSTGAYTGPYAPPATGGYTPPASTWYGPSGPSATPVDYPSASPSIESYTGAAAKHLVISGSLLAIAGLLHIIA